MLAGAGFNEQRIQRDAMEHGERSGSDGDGGV